MTSKAQPATIDADDHADAGSQTISEFSDAEGISLSQYFKIRRRGLGPDEFRVPGTKIIRITPEARADWHARMAVLQNGRAAKLEAARRRDQTVKAGRAAAISARHISKRRSDREPAPARPTPSPSPTRRPRRVTP